MQRGDRDKGSKGHINKEKISSPTSSTPNPDREGADEEASEMR